MLNLANILSVRHAARFLPRSGPYCLRVMVFGDRTGDLGCKVAAKAISLSQPLRLMPTSLR